MACFCPVDHFNKQTVLTLPQNIFPPTRVAMTDQCLMLSEWTLAVLCSQLSLTSKPGPVQSGFNAILILIWNIYDLMLPIL